MILKVTLEVDEVLLTPKKKIATQSQHTRKKLQKIYHLVRYKSQHSCIRWAVGMTHYSGPLCIKLPRSAAPEVSYIITVPEDLTFFGKWKTT